MVKQTENEISQESTTVEAEAVESAAPVATAEKLPFLKRVPKWALITLPLLSVAAIAGLGGYGYARTHASNNDQVAAYQMQGQGNDANGPVGYAPVGYAPGNYYGPQNYQNGYGYGQGYGRGYGQGYGQAQGHTNMNAHFGFGGNMNGSGNSAANGGNGWNGNNGWM